MKYDFFYYSMYGFYYFKAIYLWTALMKPEEWNESHVYKNNDND